MRYLLAVCMLLYPLTLVALEPSVNISVHDVQHLIFFLKYGGSHAEADALADKIGEEAQADLEQQKAASMHPSGRGDPGLVNPSDKPVVPP